MLLDNFTLATRREKDKALLQQAEESQAKDSESQKVPFAREDLLCRVWGLGFRV